MAFYANKCCCCSLQTGMVILGIWFLIAFCVRCMDLIPSGGPDEDGDNSIFYLWALVYYAREKYLLVRIVDILLIVLYLPLCLCLLWSIFKNQSITMVFVMVMYAIECFWNAIVLEIVTRIVMKEVTSRDDLDEYLLKEAFLNYSEFFVFCTILNVIWTGLLFLLFEWLFLSFYEELKAGVYSQEAEG